MSRNITSVKGIANIFRAGEVSFEPEKAQRAFEFTFTDFMKNVATYPLQTMPYYER